MRKKIIVMFIVSILFTSCFESDNFINTERVILTDKEMYRIGDTLKITLKVTPKEKQKKIKVYENFKNIKFFFSLSDTDNNKFVENTSQDNLIDTDIMELNITKENPLIVNYNGIISEAENKIIIDFSEIDFQISFEKSFFQKKDSYLKIHGICLPIKAQIGAAIEEYFKANEIKIKL